MARRPWSPGSAPGLARAASTSASPETAWAAAQPGPCAITHPSPEAAPVK